MASNWGESWIRAGWGTVVGTPTRPSASESVADGAGNDVSKLSPQPVTPTANAKASSAEHQRRRRVAVTDGSCYP